MNIPIEVILMPFFLFGSWFFAGIETGIITANRHRLLHLVRAGSRRARLIEEYLLDNQRLFGTLLVGNNLCTVILSTLCGSLAARTYGAVGQSVTSVVLALVVLVFCEYFPKVWFNSQPIRRSFIFVPLLRVMEVLLWPFSFLAVLFSKLLVSEHRSQQLFVTREHIQTLAHGSEVGGEISAFERLLINQVLALQLKTADKVMTPLSQTQFVAPDDTMAECYERVRNSGLLHLPVIEESSRRCLGVIDVFERLVTANADSSDLVRDHMRQPLFIPPKLHADDILPLLRRHRQTVGIVRDAESGAARGTITQENIVTALISGAMPASKGSHGKRLAG